MARRQQGGDAECTGLLHAAHGEGHQRLPAAVVVPAYLVPGGHRRGAAEGGDLEAGTQQPPLHHHRQGGEGDTWGAAEGELEAGTQQHRWWWWWCPRVARQHALVLRWGVASVAALVGVALLLFLVLQNLQRGASLAGVVAFVGVATLASNNRPAIPWPTVAWGLGLQLGLGAVILYTEVGYLAFQWLGDGAAHFLAYSDVGAEFVFGAHFTDHYIAFKVLPTIIFFSSFISVMYHLGVVQVLVKGVAWVMVKTLDTSGAESLSCSANIFVGQTEAPLVIKPFIALLTMSELHSVMASGFATVAGGVMVAYMSFGISPVHLISASVMSAPAALAMSKILYPETETPVTQGTVKVTFADSHEVNVIGAAAAGALSGGRLACNVLCILVAFLALIALVNGLLGAIGLLLHVPHLSVEWVLGWLMAPVAWLLGVPWGDCVAVGTLLGKKTVLNEFVAYLDLREMVDQQAISQRAEIIATYALCGFSNFSSMGVQIGGIGGICPERQPDLARLGLRALLAGSLACFLTACVAGLLV